MSEEFPQIDETFLSTGVYSPTGAPYPAIPPAGSRPIDEFTVERLAQLIAMWHGQKMLYRHPTEGMMTVARTRDGGSGWGWELDLYAQRHWQEYVSAAERVKELCEAQES